MSQSTLCEFLSPDQIDVLQEMINIGVGRAAESLSRLVETRVMLCVPRLSILQFEELESFQQARIGSEGKIVSQSFTGGINGQACLLLDKQSALMLSSLVAGGEMSYDELDVELEGILLEIGNIVLNSVAGAIANLLSDQLEYTVPEIKGMKSLCEVLRHSKATSSRYILGDVHLRMSEKNVESTILLAFDLGQLGEQINTLTA